MAPTEFEGQGLKAHELEQLAHARELLYNYFHRFVLVTGLEQSVELQHRCAPLINRNEALLDARIVVGCILAFPIKKKAGAYEQPCLGHLLNRGKCRTYPGLRSEPAGKSATNCSSVFLACSPCFSCSSQTPLQNSRS